MKPDFKKVLRAFDDESETEFDGELFPANCFYPNRDWQRRFCMGCELARVLVVTGESGDEGHEYVCNRVASGVLHCPSEHTDREGYRQSVPLTPGPPPGGTGGTVDVMHYLDKLNDNLDDVIDSVESVVEARNKRGHWSKSRRGIHYTCSACGGHSMNGNHKYCPMCGTLME